MGLPMRLRAIHDLRLLDVDLPCYQKFPLNERNIKGDRSTALASVEVVPGRLCLPSIDAGDSTFLG